MNDQLLTILKKAKLNFAVLGSILVLAVVGKLTNPEFKKLDFSSLLLVLGGGMAIQLPSIVGTPFSSLHESGTPPLEKAVL